MLAFVFVRVSGARLLEARAEINELWGKTFDRTHVVEHRGKRLLQPWQCRGIAGRVQDLKRWTTKIMLTSRNSRTWSASTNCNCRPSDSTVLQMCAPFSRRGSRGLPRVRPKRISRAPDEHKLAPNEADGSSRNSN